MAVTWVPLPDAQVKVQFPRFSYERPAHMLAALQTALNQELGPWSAGVPASAAVFPLASRGRRRWFHKKPGIFSDGFFIWTRESNFGLASRDPLPPSSQINDPRLPRCSSADGMFASSGSRSELIQRGSDVTVGCPSASPSHDLLQERRRLSGAEPREALSRFVLIKEALVRSYIRVTADRLGWSSG